jgi:phage terminase Nu1 subunit (DNA packaging protein)
MQLIDGYLQSTCEELANLVGVSARRIQQLETDKIVESLGHGVYDVAASVRGYCEFLRGRSLGSDTAKDEKLERIRLTKAKAGMAELSHAELIGDLVRKEEILRQDFSLARILRNNLTSIPDRAAALIAAETDPDKVHDLLEREIRASLDQIIDAMESTEVDDAALDITRARAREAIATDDD